MPFMYCDRPVRNWMIMLSRVILSLSKDEA